MRRLLFLIAVLLCARPVLGMEKYQGWCQQGGGTVTSAGIVSSTFVQRSFKTCTITVYFPAGQTTTLATLYSDNGVTPLANPFTNQTATTGQFFFYSDNGRYDIRIAATGLTAFTIGDVQLFDPSLFSHYSTVGNSGTSETDLYSDSILPTQLSANGSRIHASYSFTVAGSPGDNSRIQIYFGGTSIFDTGQVGFQSDCAGRIDVQILRQDVSTIRYSVTGVAGALGVFVPLAMATTGTLSVDLSTSQILKITGQVQGSTAASNDLLAYMGTIDAALPVAP